MSCCCICSCILLHSVCALLVCLEWDIMVAPSLGKEKDLSIKPDNETPDLHGSHYQCRYGGTVATCYNMVDLDCEPGVHATASVHTIHREGYRDSPPWAMCYFYRLFHGKLRCMPDMISGTTLTPIVAITWCCLLCCALPSSQKTIISIVVKRVILHPSRAK